MKRPADLYLPIASPVLFAVVLALPAPAPAEEANPAPSVQQNPAPAVPFACRQGLSFELSGIGARVLGAESEYLKAEKGGLGYDLGLRYNYKGFSLGVAIQRTSHDTSYRYDPGSGSSYEIGDVTVYGFAIEPRVSFPLGSRVAIYVGARLGWLHADLDINQSGMLVAATSGVLVSIIGPLAAHAGIAVALLDAYGTSYLGALRIGVAFHF